MANRAELHIVLTETGQVQVSGAIGDKMTCYALLECARDAIKDLHDAQARSSIVKADAGMLNRLNGGG